MCLLWKFILATVLKIQLSFYAESCSYNPSKISKSQFSNGESGSYSIWIIGRHTFFCFPAHNSTDWSCWYSQCPKQTTWNLVSSTLNFSNLWSQMLNKTNPNSVLKEALPPPQKKIWPNNYSYISGTLPGQEEGVHGCPAQLLKMPS